MLGTRTFLSQLFHCLPHIQLLRVAPHQNQHLAHLIAIKRAAVVCVRPLPHLLQQFSRLVVCRLLQCSSQFGVEPCTCLSLA